MPGLGYSEMLLFGMIALLLFGAKLPDVARTLGGTYRELKKSVGDFQKEFQGLSQLDVPPPSSSSRSRDREESSEEDSNPSKKSTTAAKFEPPPDDE
jgi:sec-independent protein translocase protein TatA